MNGELLLDIIPVIVMILTGIVFVRKRHRFREEKRRLSEALRELNQENEADAEE